MMSVRVRRVTCFCLASNSTIYAWLLRIGVEAHSQTHSGVVRNKQRRHVQTWSTRNVRSWNLKCEELELEVCSKLEGMFTV